jgi:hypothetical protein
MVAMDIDVATRLGLHRIAVHIVARARQQATGRFSLRVTPGGFGTPEYGDDLRKVRVSGTTLVIESDAAGATSGQAIEINGRSLRELADTVGLDLDAPLDVGRDTPDLGDVDEPIALDADSARHLAGWYARFSVALDAVNAQVGAGAKSTPVRLWPEHFDVAVDLEASPGQRVNLGGSPGDHYAEQPYLYVGPFTDARPGDDQFWNAPFGAARPVGELGEGDPVSAAVAFLLEGVDRLATVSDR